VKLFTPEPSTAHQADVLIGLDLYGGHTSKLVPIPLDAQRTPKGSRVVADYELLVIDWIRNLLPRLSARTGHFCLSLMVVVP
jgi:hypothetical protein